MQRQFTCAVLAVLVSLLSFAGMLQGRRAWWQGQGGSRADSRADAGSLLSVHLFETGKAEVPLVQVPAAGMPAWHDSAAGLTHEPAQNPMQEFRQEPIAQPFDEATHDASSALDSAPDSEKTSEKTSETTIEAVTPTAGYVPAAELSERPVLLQDLDPVLELPAGRESKVEGAAEVTASSTATAILLINRQGSVDRLLFEPPGYPRYLEAMLALRFAEMRFLPGKIDGKPVPSALRISVQLQ